MPGGSEPGWLWAIGGVVLLICELVAPGFFLLFIGAAGIATGVFTLLFGLNLPAQMILFAIYTALAVMIGRRWYAQPNTPDQRLLNEPSRRMIGRMLVVTQPVDEHGGRVKVGDGEWSARGGPAAIGERVEVIGLEGNCLMVEPVRP